MIYEIIFFILSSVILLAKKEFLSAKNEIRAMAYRAMSFGFKDLNSSMTASSASNSSTVKSGLLISASNRAKFSANLGSSHSVLRRR